MVSRAYDDRGRSTAVGTANLAGDLGKMPFLLFAGGAAGELLVGWLGDRSDTVSLIWRLSTPIPLLRAAGLH
jgi:hypothetical protein